MPRTQTALLMLENWIEPGVRHMEAEFTTHQYIERLRDLYPADYAHDLAVRTLEEGFPQSLAVLHRAIAMRLRESNAVEAIGNKRSRDIRGNKHRTLLWRRLDNRRPRRRPRERRRGPSGRRGRSERPPSPSMSSEELRAAREALGWSKSELARRAGVSLASVSRWESGKRRMGMASHGAVRLAFKTAESEG